MRGLIGTLVVIGLVLLPGCAADGGHSSGRALRSWNDGQARSSIIEFVERVTDEGSSGFVPASERIAVFDNDGTLWAEQPAYFQLLFAIDRVRSLAPDHPEWRTTEPFRSVLAGDMDALAAQGKDGLVRVVAVSHAGMTTDDFERTVRDWISTARHPTTGRLYTEMVYQPMLELLDYLRGHGFKTFIVSGGGVEFMRVFGEEVYGIPPEQVVGSRGKVAFEMRDGIPKLVKQPEIDLIDDKAGKPVGIYQVIGRRPIFAAGNSDGDLQMLQYTAISRGAADRTPRLAMIIHHTDADREWAYDRDSHIGRLDGALDEAKERGWTVVNMRRDWLRVFPEESSPSSQSE